MLPPQTISRDRIVSFESHIQKAVLEADRLGLTVAQCFEPARISAKQTALGKGWLLFVRAIDGWCWGLVRSVDDRGYLVLEREAPAAPKPVPSKEGEAHILPVPPPHVPEEPKPKPPPDAAQRQKMLDNLAKARAARTSRKAA